jgi:hypothetical protein
MGKDPLSYYGDHSFEFRPVYWLSWELFQFSSVSLYKSWYNTMIAFFYALFNS